MSHHDKFWEKFSRKIRQHQPDGYADADWQAMEQLLNERARPSRGLNRRLASLFLAAALLGYLAGARFGMPSPALEISAFPIPVAGIAQRQQAPVQEGGAMDTQNRKTRGRLNESSQIEKQAARSLQPSGQAEARRSKEHPPLPARSSKGILLPGEPARQIGQGRIKEAAAPATGQLSDNNSLDIPSIPIPEKQIAPLSALPPEAVRVATAERNDILAGASGPSRKARRNFYAGVLLGGNLSIGNPGSAGYSFYPFGGFFAGVGVGPRWAIQAEAHIKYTGNVSAEYERTTKVQTSNGYLFDQVSRGTLDKNYLSVETPLEAKYRLSPAWSLLAGIRPALIIEEGPSLFGGAVQDEALNPSSGFGQGRAESYSDARLRKFDLGVSAALEWAFHRRWSLNARFSRGLVDLSPEQVFRTQEKHFNSGFQLSIRRKF